MMINEQKPSMFLTPEEVTQLTGHRRKDAQLHELRYMGIDHRKRRDGSIAVLRSHVEEEFGFDLGKKDNKEKDLEPNWGAMHA